MNQVCLFDPATNSRDSPAVFSGVTDVLYLSFGDDPRKKIYANIGDTFRSGAIILDMSGLHVLSESCFFSISITRRLAEIALPSMDSVGDNFLYNMLDLRTINLDPIAAAQTIGGQFLHESGTATVTCSKPLQAQYIGRFFLARNMVRSLDLTFGRLEETNAHFISNCPALETATLTFSALRRIGDEFMARCECLKTLRLHAPALERVDFDFLADCGLLESVLLDMPILKSIGIYLGPECHFMRGCAKLRSVEINCRRRVWYHSPSEFFMRESLPETRLKAFIDLAKYEPLQASDLLCCDRRD